MNKLPPCVSVAAIISTAGGHVTSIVAVILEQEQSSCELD